VRLPVHYSGQPQHVAQYGHPLREVRPTIRTGLTAPPAANFGMAAGFGPDSTTINMEDPMLDRLSSCDLHTYLTLVRRIAVSTRRRYPLASVDDLVSAGSLGLVEAGRKFKPERGVAFGAFARVVIRGRMLDHVRQESRNTTTCRELAAHSSGYHGNPTEHFAAVDELLGITLSRLSQLGPHMQTMISGAMEGDSIVRLAAKIGISKHRAFRLRSEALEAIRLGLK